MGRFEAGDYVKVEFKDEASGESEWMWVELRDSDDARRIMVGKLDNEPIVNTDLRLGMELAVGYDLVRGAHEELFVQSIAVRFTLVYRNSI